MADSSGDELDKFHTEFDVLANTIQTNEPRYKSLERIIDWGFAIGIGTILSVISNYDRFRLSDPNPGAYLLRKLIDAAWCFYV